MGLLHHWGSSVALRVVTQETGETLVWYGANGKRRFGRAWPQNEVQESPSRVRISTQRWPSGPGLSPAAYIRLVAAVVALPDGAPPLDRTRDEVLTMARLFGRPPGDAGLSCLGCGQIDASRRRSFQHRRSRMVPRRPTSGPSRRLALFQTLQAEAQCHKGAYRLAPRLSGRDR